MTSGPPNTPPGGDSPNLPPVVPGNGYVPPESIPTPGSGGGGAVSSVEGRTGAVDVVIEDLDGLQAALDLKASTDSVAAKYTKPGPGIPKADLVSAVQTSLGLADSALQSVAVAGVTGLTAALTAKAPSASPAFTGTPTGITKAHVGLGSADNTADVDKPVSTAQATALTHKVSVVVYSGSLTTTRPTADAVYWVDYPSTPTNAQSQDIVANASDLSLSTTVHAATNKTVPVDADELFLVDSAASNGPKKITWATLRTKKIISEYAGTTSLTTQAFPTSGGKSPAGVSVSVMIHPGSGGGSGRRGAAGSIRGGGSGGSSGGVLREFYIPASAFGASWSLTIPAPGTGGAAVTVNDTNGNNGGAPGSNTSFVTGNVRVIATSGDVGQGGTATGSPAPTYGGGVAGAIGLIGVASSATGGPGVTAGPTFGGPSSAPAGSSGGGITAANVAGAGAAGGYNPYLSAGAGGTAGVVDSTAPGVVAAIAGVPGAGAGSGAASITAAAQAGATGTGYGVGGAGGGASLNGNNSGAGGAGGPGFVRLIWDFS